MNNIKVISIALAMTLIDRANDLLSVFIEPKVNSLVKTNLGKPSSPWLVTNILSRKTIDGAILFGSGYNVGAKYTIPKGLPKEGQRVLAIENEPHTLEGFNGVIKSGYGKGRKSLLFNERVPVKSGGVTSIRQIEYHLHNADVAGIHYDLAIEGLPLGTEQFEINIPNGEYKGRFAFIQTDKGIIVTPMKDRGVMLPKPQYRLKDIEFLEQKIKPNINDYVIERKYDGSFANANIAGSEEVIFRSHREGGQAYYNRLPGLTSIKNISTFFTLRTFDKGPSLENTLLKVELVHRDGVSRTSGILNSHPEKALITQEKRGLVKAVAWDIMKLKGKDVSNLPYGQRRQLLEDTIKTIRLYNKNYYIAEKYTGNDPVEFYLKVINDPRGLPYSEGIVVKNKNLVEESYFKIKNRDFQDLIAIAFIEGTGKYSNNLGAMLVEDPTTGGQGEIGSFGITDAERTWIWLHRNELEGAVAKISVMELTNGNSPRAGVFHSWHPDPRYGKIGSELALAMYAEASSGMDPEQSSNSMFAMKTKAGWRKK